MRKIRPWKIKELAQSQTTTKWWSRGSAASVWLWRPIFFTSVFLWVFIYLAWICTWIWPLRNGTILSWGLWGGSSRGKGRFRKNRGHLHGYSSHLAIPPLGILCSLKADLSFLIWKMDILTPLGTAVSLEVKNVWSAYSTVLQLDDLEALVPGT